MPLLHILRYRYLCVLISLRPLADGANLPSPGIHSHTAHAEHAAVEVAFVAFYTELGEDNST